MTVRSIPQSRILGSAVRLLVAATWACFAFAISASPRAEQAKAGQAAYKTSDEAIEALVASVKSNDKDAIVKVLGPEALELVNSGDPVYDALVRDKFIAALAAYHELESVDEARRVLVLGTEKYPFPIPLVLRDNTWRFDTGAGKEEILNRRIGENELRTMQVMLAFVDAQRDYASVDHDGKGLQYARRLLSTQGKRDGLYWETAEGEPPSPMGPLIAQAKTEGYTADKSDTGPAAYHGYVFKLLTAQGPNAPGGVQQYIVNGRMIAGYGLVATPAEYANSGVMTFIVNQDGVVYEKDLGPESRARMAKMKVYDPDSTWRRADAD